MMSNTKNNALNKKTPFFLRKNLNRHKGALQLNRGGLLHKHADTHTHLRHGGENATLDHEQARDDLQRSRLVAPVVVGQPLRCRSIAQLAAGIVRIHIVRGPVVFILGMMLVKSNLTGGGGGGIQHGVK